MILWWCLLVVIILFAIIALAVTQKYYKGLLIQYQQAMDFIRDDYVKELEYLLMPPAGVPLNNEIKHFLLSLASQALTKNKTGLVKSDTHVLTLAAKHFASRDFSLRSTERVKDIESAVHCQRYLLALEQFINKPEIQSILGIDVYATHVAWLAKAIMQVECDVLMKLTINSIVDKKVASAKLHFNNFVNHLKREMLYEINPSCVDQLDKLIRALETTLIRDIEDEHDEEEAWEAYVLSKAPTLKKHQ